jgi:hypothetical protein
MVEVLEQTRGIIHGPFKTKRLGSTLAIDLSAPQENMVVERGSSLPRGSLVVTTCARRMIDLSKAGEKVESVVVTGAGLDPAEHPDLREVTENLRVLRTKWFQRARLCIVTGTTDLEAYERRAALSLYDRVFARFEWGTAKTFAAASGAKSPALALLTRQLAGFDRLVVQANFYRGAVDNSTPGEIDNWIRKLETVRPTEVHILAGTGRHVTKKVRAVPAKRLKQIADAVAERTGLSVSVYEEEPLLAG